MGSKRSIWNDNEYPTVASTSRISLQDASSECTCLLAPNRRRERSNRRAIAVASLAMVTLAPPFVNASPVLSPKQRGKQRAIDTERRERDLAPQSRPTNRLDVSTAIPTARPVEAETANQVMLRKRGLLPQYYYSDGEWHINTTWRFNGRPVPAPTRAPGPLSPTGRTGGVDGTAGDSNAVEDELGVEEDHGDVIVTRTVASSTFSADVTGPSAIIPKIAAADAPSSSSTHSPSSTATPASFTVPAGWQPKPRETNYYAVPIIVTMSVLIAVTVAGTVIGSVLWRRKKRNAKKRRRERRRAAAAGTTLEKPSAGGRLSNMVEKVRGGLSGGRRGGHDDSDNADNVNRVPNPATTSAGPVTAALSRERTRSSTGSGGSGRRTAGEIRQSIVSGTVRLRYRRRHRSRAVEGAAADASDDEVTALTASESRRSADGVTPHDTLTSRLQARLRHPLQHQQPSSPTNRQGPSTVFSRDLEIERTPTQSSVQSQQSQQSSSRLSLPVSLSRMSSRSSVGQLEPVLPLHRVPSPTPSHRSNGSFGMGLDVSLPALGPPAYRPAGSTVQNTRRGPEAHVIPSPAIASTSSGSRAIRRVPVPAIQTPTPADHDDEQWHWPNEKHLPAQPVAGSSVAQSASSELDDSDSIHDASAPPPVDRSEFSAHLATDDKAVLARIRQQAALGSNAPAGEMSALALATAPERDDDDDELDEDGFPAFAASSTAAALVPAPSAPDHHELASLLPPPPKPVIRRSRTTSVATPGVGEEDVEEVGVCGVQRTAQALPMYSRGRQALEMASAPPSDDVDEASVHDVDWYALEEGRDPRGSRIESAEI